MQYLQSIRRYHVVAFNVTVLRSYKIYLTFEKAMGIAFAAESVSPVCRRAVKTS